MVILEEIKLALKTIKEFTKLNGIKLTPEIKIDYKLDSAGCTYWNWDGKSIYINPKICKTQSKHKGHYDLGHLNSYDLTSICLHEFGHLLMEKFGIHKDFIKTSPTIVNSNAAQSRLEEFAEIFTIFITNPYFLKILNEDCLNFLKERFKSPTSCSKKYFMKIYATWDDSLKKRTKDTLGIHVEKRKIIVNRSKVNRFLNKN